MPLLNQFGRSSVRSEMAQLRKLVRHLGEETNRYCTGKVSAVKFMGKVGSQFKEHEIRKKYLNGSF